MGSARKLVAVILAILMTAMLFSACGSPASSEAKGGSSGAAAGSSDEPVEISIAFWAIGKAIPEEAIDDEVRDLIYKKLNIKIKPVDITWDDYEQKVPLWATSGQLPDVFAFDLVGKPLMKEWVDQGVIKPLPDDMSAYPNLNAILEAPEFMSYKYPLGSDDAKYYGIPRPNYRDNNWVANDFGIIVRKDWMEKLGKSEPANFDEFIDLMVAFAKEDPDGDGQNDTLGFVPFDQNYMGSLMNSFEPGLTAGGTKAVWVRDKKNPGQWIPSFMTDGALEGYKAIRKLHDDGGLDPDFATIKGEEGLDKFVNGAAGALGYGGNYGSLWRVWDKYTQVDPNAKFEDTFMVIKPFKNADGNYYRYLQNAAWSETYLNADITPEKQAKVFELYDYLLSEEGYRAIHFGIEGKTWELKDGKVEVIPSLDADGNPKAIGEVYPFCYLSSFAEWSGTGAYSDPVPFPQIQKSAVEMRDWLLENAKPIETDLRLGLLDYPSKDKDTGSFKDDVSKIVLSNDVEATFNQVVSDYMANGYGDVIKQVNELAKEYDIK